jgi:hypothetical protein
MFGFAEKAQLKMHSANLTRAQNFRRDNHGSTELMRSAVYRAVSLLLTKLQLDANTSVDFLVERVPLEECDVIADFLMKASEESAKSVTTLADYYSLDLLCGLFRSRTIEFRRPKLTSKIAHYRYGALHLINFYLSQEVESKETKAPEVRPQISDIAAVRQVAKYLGLQLTPYGVGLALVSVQSGYSSAETASHLAVLTLARDVQEAGTDLDARIRFYALGMAILKRMKELKDDNRMREEIWRNDSTTIGKIMIPSTETLPWINKVLSGSIDGAERVANFEIKW